jgi:hypothetical protein
MHRNWDGLSLSAPWAMIGEARSRERVFAMTTAILDAKTHEFDVEDVEYLRHGDKPLLARVFKPRGAFKTVFCTCTRARVMGSYSESEKASQHREMPSNAVAALLLSGRDQPSF